MNNTSKIYNEEGDILFEGSDHQALQQPIEEDHVLEQVSYHTQVMGSTEPIHHHRRYLMRFSQVKQNERLDAEAQDRMLEHLRDTFDKRVAVLGEIMDKTHTIATLRGFGDAEDITLPNKARKAQLIGILAHELQSRDDVDDVKNTNRRSKIPTGDEEE